MKTINIGVLVRFFPAACATWLALGAGSAFADVTISNGVTYLVDNSNTTSNNVNVRVWNESNLLTMFNGSILQVQPNLTPPMLTNSVSGTTLSLSWPADRLGYTLQVKTSSLNQGLSGGMWNPVPGSSSVTSMNLPVNMNSDTVFYRLLYP
jgi:hypothetical protein